MKMKTYMTKSRMLLSCIHPTLGKKSLMKVISNIVVVCIWMPKKCVLLSCIFSPVQISKKERKKKKKGNFKVLWYFITKCLCFVILDALDISCMWQFYLSSRRSFIISVENIKEKKNINLHNCTLMSSWTSTHPWYVSWQNLLAAMLFLALEISK